MVLHIFTRVVKCVCFNGRFNLPILLIIVNNNGIFSGTDADTYESVPPHERPSRSVFSSCYLSMVALLLLCIYRKVGNDANVTSLLAK